jgi:ABC-type sugar transport system ATPase subunit
MSTPTFNGDPGPARGGQDPPLLEAYRINKSFGGIHALRSVDLTCHAGQVQALVGENGAGKSTLTAVLAGVHQPEEGEIRMNGEEVRFTSPRDALARGIAVVYQEFTLLPHLSVAENIFLGHEPARGSVVRHRELRERAAALLDQLGMGRLPLTAPVRRLSVAQQQVVEIAKALAHNARLLIMDEPSAVLAGAEFEHLADLIKRLASRGVSIIYISHRLDEVEAVADQVTVLRDGQVVVSAPAGQLSRDDIVRSMVGRTLDEAFPVRRADEVVGVGGLVGSGRSRLARALVGLERAPGTVKIRGRPFRHRSVRAAAGRGLVLIPEDRKGAGLVLDLPIAANVSLPVLGRVSNSSVLSRQAETSLAQDTIRTLGIRASGPDQRVRQLSGGNQQKVVLGKWLAADPAVLLLDEPLRGVDVGAKEEIYGIIRDLADQGSAILVISSELPELLGLSDRILVMRDGRVAGELSREQASEEAVMALAIGEEVTAA